MAIRVITLFNKPDYVQTAIECVRTQTRECKHIVASHDAFDWGDRFPPAAWVNWKWREAEPDDYCIWLSDDDWWHPTLIEELAGYLDRHPEANACYTASRHVLYDIDEGEIKYIRTLGGEHNAYHKERDPGGYIDGGQVLVRRSALDDVGYPYQLEDMKSRHCDANYLQRLSIYQFHRHSVKDNSRKNLL